MARGTHEGRSRQPPGVRNSRGAVNQAAAGRTVCREPEGHQRQAAGHDEELLEARHQRDGRCRVGWEGTVRSLSRRAPRAGRLPACPQVCPETAAEYRLMPLSFQLVQIEVGSVIHWLVKDYMMVYTLAPDQRRQARAAGSWEYQTCI